MREKMKENAKMVWPCSQNLKRHEQEGDMMQIEIFLKRQGQTDMLMYRGKTWKLIIQQNRKTDIMLPKTKKEK